MEQQQATAMKRILIVGSSGHAKSVIDTIEKEGKFTIVGLIDDFRDSGECLGYKILGSTEDLKGLVRTEAIYGLVIAIGDNFSRQTVHEKIAALCPGLRFVSTVHPSAVIGRDVSIGPGTVIMSGVSVNSGTVIGDFCILNTHSSLDHDCLMKNYSSLAPGVNTGGYVWIGWGSAIGVGAKINHKICIGDHCVIGSGACVVKDFDDYSLAYGVPARLIRERKAGEKYL
jgi:sugar O-acyltransferase (sialic acid O-acetyltransferase NeuD family)